MTSLEQIDLTDPTVERLCALLRTRSKTGCFTYGTTLENNSEEDLVYWLRHTQEELLDAAAYIEKLISLLSSNEQLRKALELARLHHQIMEASSNVERGK